ncbi:protein-disulfide reductase DsbD [Viridibacterium curvum]|uniref:Protein-disulfide reductase DsbD n=1 Tax=Viridibacterium curvum TaxID=1101404 RepID=A0ABP9QLS3_9RHOO
MYCPPLRRARVAFVSLLACILGFALPVAHAVEEPLPPDQAFRMQATLQADETASLRFTVAPGYYLYLNKFQFRGEDGLQLTGAPRYPQGEAHEDRFFGRQTIFREQFDVNVPVRIDGKSPRLVATVQGCSEALGVCYPPTDIAVELALFSKAPTSTGGLMPGLERPATGMMDTPGASLQTPPAVIVDDEESGRLGRLLSAGSLLPIVLAFFGLGLLLAFTPCVLPMVPILSSIIVGKADNIDRLRALKLSTAYVLGMAITYALAGVLAGLSGASLALWLQNIWVLGAFALVFVLLALPMFGLFELQMPAALQSRLASVANRQQGSLPGVTLMGAVSALIVGPCMTAPLAAALLSIAQTGNATVGGVALFAMALGMGVPLIVVGVMARHWLPKPGPWMDLVKGFFGWLLLATALWLLYPVLPPRLLWLCVAALLALPAILLLRRSHTAALAARRRLRIASALFGLAAASTVVFAVWQSRLQAEQVGPSFATVQTLDELQARLAAAPGPVMLDVYADWCVSCRELEHYTFRDPAVAHRLSGFTLLRADVTQNNEENRALLKAFQLHAPPAMLFFRNGQLNTRVVGFRDAKALLSVLDRQLER